MTGFSERSVMSYNRCIYTADKGHWVTLFLLGACVGRYVLTALTNVQISPAESVWRSDGTLTGHQSHPGFGGGEESQRHHGQMDFSHSAFTVGHHSSMVQHLQGV